MIKYKINLINRQQTAQKMWCFLSEPEAILSQNIYANSNTYLMVPPYSSDKEERNAFKIPLQYVLKVGASTNAVKLGTCIDAQVTQDIELGTEWKASYVQRRCKQIVPKLTKKDRTTSKESLAIFTNRYNKSKELPNDWYGNMTFGIKTKQGFTGCTWSPEPNVMYRIKPEFVFYVAIGAYKPNTLANINAMSATLAKITARDFDANYECTVIREADGSWTVVRGYVPPLTNAETLRLLLKRHLELTRTHHELIKQVSNGRILISNEVRK